MKRIEQAKNLIGGFSSIPSLIKQRGGIFSFITKKLLKIVREEGFDGIKRRLFYARFLSKYKEWIRLYGCLDEVSKQKMVAEIETFSYKPKVSIIMPVYDPPIQFLEEAIWSIRRQLYSHWELCIANDASKNHDVQQVLERHSSEDARIKTFLRQNNGHISAASNSALELASGEFVALMDHDDLLPEHALFWLAKTIISNPDVDLIYSDEDKIEANGQRVFPFFKPDWSPHLAISQAYLGHLICIRSDLVGRLQGWQEGTEGAQDYDLWLRASIFARKIVHIPEILYHWRIHPDSTAQDSQAKPYAHEVGRSAVQSYIKSRYPTQNISVESGDHLFTYRLQYNLQPDQMVSIIIPTRDRVDLLKPCIESILHESSWRNFEIIVLDNGSCEPSSLTYFEEIVQLRDQVRVVDANMPFNWSRLNNLGVQHANGDVFLFLNNDTKVISKNWLEYLIGYACLPDVATVGALLLFEDETIQHSGIVVGMGGWADHVFRAQAAEHTPYGPFVSPMLTRNVLAVTGACMAIERKKYEMLGGFDEEFIICGSDTELGLRAHKKELFNVLCAEAKLYHLESKTRTSYIPESDFVQSSKKYSPYRIDQIDPFFNPNLSLDSTKPTFNFKK